MYSASLLKLRGELKSMMVQTNCTCAQKYTQQRVLKQSTCAEVNAVLIVVVFAVVAHALLDNLPEQSQPGKLRRSLSSMLHDHMQW